ncbi:hypothetical protein SAPIO_CDS1964 [Scedosporium apiospermum]|uniref:Major facilitator superfamily (MFS) profile domain-containing protein n=1 Tax=Pseudallescheria apiosperma TaxID=563466 RepID=A0A084GE48_PSEDA|nr:uncharacterized protein SAPIO_CDS1964 [Scedosporium apiospermum]KEZ45610.1 hypothetical protein SAPIO_CDS1964 [Scedosporium apiospermum]
MGLLQTFLPEQDRFAALLLYGMIFATCFNGYDAGIMTVILADEQFNEYYNVDDVKTGVIATVPWATTGELLSLAQLFVGGTLANYLGRLWALLAECSPRTLRGSFVGTVNQFGYQLGTLIAFWTGYGMSFHKSPYNIAWRVSNVIQIPIGLTFFVLSFWYPESPRWLYDKYPDVPERSLSSLCKLRSGSATSEHVQQEFHELVASHEYRKRFKTGYRAIFSSKGMRKRLAYGLFATALQQAGGIAALTMYAAIIYKSLGWDQGSEALVINGVQAVIQLFIVLINTFTVDRYGRKKLLMAGFSIQALALLVMSCLTTAFPNNDNKAAAVAEVVCLFIVGMTYCWSNGPIAPAVASEIFPQEVRDKAFGVSLLGQTVCLLALTQPWPRFNNQVGGKSYWLLFSLNVAVFFILPETKGISLERMDKIFGEVDAVAAGEDEEKSGKIEAPTFSHNEQAHGDVGNLETKE